MVRSSDHCLPVVYRPRPKVSRDVRCLYLLEALEPRVLLATAPVIPTPSGFQTPLVRPSSDGIILGASFTDLSGIYLARLNEDGTPDSSFGNDGAAVIQGVGPLAQMLVQPDGKVLVLTIGLRDGVGSLLRFDRDGTSDSTFGQDGRVALIDASANWWYQSGDLALTSDGRIIVAQALTDPEGYADDVGIFQFTSTGHPDQSFGTDGLTRVRCPIDFYWVGDIAIGGDGGISVLAAPWTFAIYVVRTDSAGRPDSHLGSGGLTIVDDSTAPYHMFVLAGDGDGLLSVDTAGYADGLVVHRLMTDGQPNRSFASEGVTVLDTGKPIALWAGIMQLEDQRVVFFCRRGGWSWSSSTIVEMNRDGSLDQNFGAGTGFVDLPHPGQYWEGVQMDAATDARGRIITATVLGTGYGMNGPLQFQVLRFEPDGSLDLSFGSQASVLLDVADLKGPPPITSPEPDPEPDPIETPSPVVSDLPADSSSFGGGEQSVSVPAALPPPPTGPQIIESANGNLVGLFRTDGPLLGTATEDLLDG
ncbi:MAG: hypothetical protein JWN40_1539 [Phycisphaerales bacterium]|nr:hypothetical protein [Phycisphaerales bacterium]